METTSRPAETHSSILGTFILIRGVLGLGASILYIIGASFEATTLGFGASILGALVSNVFVVPSSFITDEWIPFYLPARYFFLILVPLLAAAMIGAGFGAVTRSQRLRSTGALLSLILAILWMAALFCLIRVHLMDNGESKSLDVFVPTAIIMIAEIGIYVLNAILIKRR